MAHWNGEKVVRWPTIESMSHSGWEIVDCGCCNGIQWGSGENEPRECNRCKGGGVIYHHKKSHVLALYPGGPFCGKLMH